MSISVVEYANLVEVLRHRASCQPAQLAYQFLSNKGDPEKGFTYADLDQRARAIGAQLQQLRAAGERAILFYPSGLDYVTAFFGCLYSGVIAVPVYPTQSAKLSRAAAQRLLAIMKDAQSSVLLTNSQFIASLEQLAEVAPEFRSMQWLVTDTLSLDLAKEWQEPALTTDTLAFLQYTSGSTATPKGVMLTHRNLLTNSSLLQTRWETTAESLMVSWLPLYHDMGLIGCVLHALTVGFPLVLLSPFSFLQRPLRWLQAIADYKATISGAPNFAYDLCVRKITAEQCASLDLSHWKVAFNGAEPVRADTLQRFASQFAACGFRPEALYPCYGLAEATLMVSGGTVSALPVERRYDSAALRSHQAVPTTDIQRGQVLIGCGQASPSQQLCIVDPVTRHRVPAGAIGEIWVSGPSIAQGYWKRPEATAETFQASLAETEEGPFLRTGDLGVLDEGELFITGRLKDLIIIRGQNYAPQDLERTVAACHEGFVMDGGAAFSVEVAGEEQVVIVQELSRHARHLDLDVMVATIRQALAEAHQLQIYAVVLIKTGYLPKTSSGKVQRQACRALFLENRLEVVHRSIMDQEMPNNEEQEDRVTRERLVATEPKHRLPLLERSLLRHLARVLHMDPEQLGPHQVLSTLGLDSLMAIEMQYALETRLDIVLPTATFLEDVTVRQVAEDMLRQIADISAQSEEGMTGSETRTPRGKGKSERGSPLVRIQPYGSRRPLFLVHPLSGMMTHFTKLGRFLGADQPFYGLQARGLAGEQEPHRTVEEMARAYVTAIRGTQPEGPYLLAGVCVGGIIAFEMAQQLHAQGQRVSLLALLDTINIPMVRRSHKREQTASLQAWQETIYDPEQRQLLLASLNATGERQSKRSDYELLWPLLFNKPLPLPLASLEHLRNLEGEDERIHYILEQLGPTGRAQHARLVYPHAAHALKVRKYNILALMNYIPRPYPSHVTLIRSRELAEKYLEDPHLGWGDLASGRVKMYDLPIAHEMLDSSNIEMLVKQLKRCLLEAQEEEITLER